MSDLVAIQPMLYDHDKKGCGEKHEWPEAEWDPVQDLLFRNKNGFTMVLNPPEESLIKSWMWVLSGQYIMIAMLISQPLYS